MKKSYVLVEYGTRVDGTTFKAASVEEYDTEEGFFPAEEKEVENEYSVKYEYHFPSDEDKCRETVLKINEEAKADDIYGNERRAYINADGSEFTVSYDYFDRIITVNTYNKWSYYFYFNLDTGKERKDENYENALLLIEAHDKCVNMMKNRKNG